MKNNHKNQDTTSYAQKNMQFCRGFFGNSFTLNTGSTLMLYSMANLNRQSLPVEIQALVKGVFDLVTNLSNYYQGTRDNHTKAGILRGAAETSTALVLFGINAYALCNGSNEKNAPLLFYCKRSLEIAYKSMDDLLALGYSTMAVSSMSMQAGDLLNK